jgi:hypothetical protein
LLFAANFSGSSSLQAQTANLFAEKTHDFGYHLDLLVAVT